MKSKLWENYGGFKVWQRPMNRGLGTRYEVRQGNRVLSRHSSLFAALEDAKRRMNAWWDEQARVLREERGA